MDRLPSISIVMPSLNQGQFIQQAIESVLCQNYPALELIVVDGGSSDNTITILKNFGSAVRWISEPDLGQSDAINKGLAVAKGELFAWLNSDDLYENGSFHAAATYFSENPAKQWIFGPCSIVNEHGKRIRWPISLYKNFQLRRYSFSKLLVENFIPQMGVFMKREMVLQLGKLDTTLHYAMDYDLWLRFGARFAPGYVRHPIARFRMYGKSKSVTGFRTQFNEDLRVAKRYAGNRRFTIVRHAINNFMITMIYRLMYLAKLS